MTKDHRWIAALAVFLIGWCLVGIANAQTAAWDTNTVTWNAVTTCTSGQPVANCPVAHYRVERSATTGGAYASVGTSTSTTFTHLSAASGQNCYRVIAVSTSHGESVPSNVACKTNTPPAGPPNPPTNLRFVDTVAFDIRKEGTRWYLSRAVAEVKPGAVPVSRYAIDGKAGYCQVRRADTVAVKASKGVLVAACA